jgi:predicted DNA-binding transcriptional regulator YafY
VAEMDKGKRLLDLSRRFSEGAFLTMQQIIDQYGIDRRTVQRDLETLRDAGRLELTFDENSDGTRLWYLKESVRKIGVTYSISDVMALFLGRRMFDFLENTLLEDAIGRVYKQIESKIRKPDDRLRAKALTKKIYLVHEGPKKLKKESQEVLDTCLDGLLRDEKINIRYRTSAGETNSYTIHPYTLTAYKRGLYLISYVEEKQTVLVFSLERIKRAERLDKSKFAYPEDFNPETFFENALFITIGKPEPVELVFTATTKPFIGIRKFHRSQKLKSLNDGRIQMNLTVPVNFETVNFVLSFGRHVEVVKPESLREMVRCELKEALASYLPRT